MRPDSDELADAVRRAYDRALPDILRFIDRAVAEAIDGGPATDQPRDLDTVRAVANRHAGAHVPVTDRTIRDLAAAAAAQRADGPTHVTRYLAAHQRRDVRPHFAAAVARIPNRYIYVSPFADVITGTGADRDNARGGDAHPGAHVLDPDVVGYWNGKPVHEGPEAEHYNRLGRILAARRARAERIKRERSDLTGLAAYHNAGM